MATAFVVNREDVISARGLAKELGKSINTVFKGIENGYFQAQMTGKNPATGKQVYGFREEYAAEVKRALPKETINGAPLFSPSVVKALERINKKWMGRKVEW